MQLSARLRSSALGAGGLLAFALLAGRFSGLSRELILASHFGVSAQADVAVVLLTLPDLLVNLLLSGGLSAALVPRLRALPRDQAAKLFQMASLWGMLVFSMLGLAIAGWPSGVFTIFAPGLSHPVGLIGDHAMVLLALSVPLTALSGVTAAYLNADERFFVAGLGTLIFNLTIIAALLCSPGGGGLFLLASAILAGAALRLFSQLVILPGHAWRIDTGSATVDRRFFHAFFAGIAASSLALLPPALIRAAASLLGTGNIAIINYSQKLVELPLGILITTISTITLTKLSGHYGNGDAEAAKRTLHQSLKLSLVLAILIVVFGEFLAEPIVSLIFHRGAIDSGDAGRIANLMRVILIGVPFIALSSLATAALNAQLRTSEVLRMTLLSLTLLAILAVPGLVLSSDKLLMGAVAGSQAALAWFLARRAGICLWGADGVVDRQSFKAIGCGLVVAIIFAIIACFFAHENVLVAIGLGAAGFASALGTSIIVARH